MSEPTFDFDQPLNGDGEAIDPDALLDYSHELVALFLDAPEGEPFDDEEQDAAESAIVELVSRAVVDHGVRPHRLTPQVLEKVLFEGLPRSWRHPAEAESILEELTAFMRFAGRALRVPTAAGCVALLEAEGTQARLADAFRTFNRGCPDPELAAFLKEEGDANEDEKSPSPGGKVRSRDEQRQAKDKKKDKKKAKRRNRR